MKDLSNEELLALYDKTSEHIWEWENLEIETDDEGTHIYVPQGSHLGDTLIALDDTYETSGEDCLYIQEACKAAPRLIKEIQELKNKYEII